MSSHFLLTFGTDTGNSKTLRIPNAIAGISTDLVLNAMNMIISTDAFSGRQGRLRHPRRASFVEISSRDFVV
jgi:hypothetical protein